MMNTIIKYAGVVALVILAIMGVGKLIGSQGSLAGSTSCASITCLSGGLRLVTGAGGDFEADVASIFSGTVSLTSTFKLGSSGTAQSNEVITTCSMFADNSIVASSTGYAYCTGVTGVTSSDNVLAMFATSTLGYSMQSDGFEVVSAKASSTAGAIDFIVSNNSGKTNVPSAVGRIGSTTVIYASH